MKKSSNKKANKKVSADLKSAGLSHRFADKRFLENLPESMPDGLAVKDARGIITYVSDRFCNILGHDNRELIGQSFEKFLDKSSLNDFRKLDRACKNGESSSGEIAFIKRDGGRYDTLVYQNPVFDQEGIHQGDMVIITDDTRIERAAKALKKADRYSSRGLLILRKGKILYADRIFCDIFGYSVEEFLSFTAEHFINMMYSDYRDILRDKLQSGLPEGPGEPSFEFMAARKNGEELRGEIFIRSVEHEGRPSVQIAVTEITDQKTASVILEERLKFETLLSEFSAAFVNLPGDKIDEAIKNWLQRITEFLGIERITMIELSDDEPKFSIAHSWAVEGYDPILPIPEAKQLPWLSRKVLGGEMVRFTKIDELPKRAAKEKQYFKKRNLKSSIILPLLAGGSFLGVLAFSALRSERNWPDRLVQRLRLVGEIFANAIKHKKNENALRESEEKFRQLAEQSPNMIFINQGGRIRYVNARCEEVMGYPCTEYYNDDFDFMVLIDPDYRDKIRKNFKEHSRRLDVPPAECALRTRSGEKIDAIITTRLIKYGGEPAILGIAADITGIKRTKDKLKESEENFKALAENANDGFLVRTLKGNQVFANKAASMITGFSLEELKQKPIEKLAATEELKKFRSFLGKRSQEDNALKQHQTVFVRKNGSRVPVEITATETTWQKQPAVMFVFRNITERKMVEDKLKSAGEELKLERDALQKKSIALMEVSSSIEIEKNAIRHQIETKIEKVILPIIGKLKEAGEEHRRKYMEMLERELEELYSAKEDKLSNLSGKLTPRQMEICRMIKRGHLSKEISEMLNVSILTVHKHREIIRKKLGIRNKGINLNSYLQLL